MSEQQGIPLKWPELIELHTRYVDETLAMVPQVVADMRGEDRSVGLHPLAVNLARCVIVAGLDRCRPMVRMAGDALDQVLSDFAGGIDDGNVFLAAGVLNFANLLRCSGERVPAEVDEPAWLAAIAPHKKMLEEKRQHSLALASLAVGESELVPKFIGGGKLPKTFKPGEAFQFNVQGFVRYMAVAMNHGAAAEDVGPAWGEFVQVFPRKLATKTLDWIDLFWATRAFLVHFEKRDAGEVAQDLYDYVRE
jgi:hypothetical protein